VASPRCWPTTTRFEQHIADTLTVGDGLCDREGRREHHASGGAGAGRALLALGVNLDRTPDGALDLTREGGHSRRRVVHYEDVTGREIQRALMAAVAAEHQHHHARRAHRGGPAVHGQVRRRARRASAPTCSCRRTGVVKTIWWRKATVLASGGTGKVYVYTSNPDVATGDGIAMAYRMGAAVADLEFVQFHPTVLYHPHAGSFLISEALRGEGGILRLATGETSSWTNYHPLKSLGPRDVVARAIDNELKKSGADSVFLDMTHLEPAFVRKRFPNIHERCLALGIDITKQPIPVVPAAHYMCGGVKTDEDGQTTVKQPVRDRRGARTPGSTARVGWPRTRCSRAWCTRAAPPSM
jgi:L-aspartate oxidase